MRGPPIAPIAAKEAECVTEITPRRLTVRLPVPACDALLHAAA
jgi:hypothetical protein